MNENDLKNRTKTFAKRVINLCSNLPKTQSARMIGNQLFRSGTSVGANYRAACRGRSKADFVSKLGIVLEEIDESMYWMELLIETGIISEDRLAPLLNEANELTAIIVASINTSKKEKDAP